MCRPAQIGANCYVAIPCSLPARWSTHAILIPTIKAFLKNSLIKTSGPWNPMVLSVRLIWYAVNAKLHLGLQQNRSNLWLMSQLFHRKLSSIFQYSNSNSFKEMMLRVHYCIWWNICSQLIGLHHFDIFNVSHIVCQKDLALQSKAGMKWFEVMMATDRGRCGNCAN